MRPFKIIPAIFLALGIVLNFLISSVSLAGGLASSPGIDINIRANNGYKFGSSFNVELDLTYNTAFCDVTGQGKIEVELIVPSEINTGNLTFNDMSRNPEFVTTNGSVFTPVDGSGGAFKKCRIRFNSLPVTSNWYIETLVIYNFQFPVWTCNAAATELITANIISSDKNGVACNTASQQKSITMDRSIDFLYLEDVRMQNDPRTFICGQNEVYMDYNVYIYNAPGSGYSAFNFKIDLVEDNLEVLRVERLYVGNTLTTSQSSDKKTITYTDNSVPASGWVYYRVYYKTPALNIGEHFSINGTLTLTPEGVCTTDNALAVKTKTFSSAGYNYTCIEGTVGSNEPSVYISNSPTYRHNCNEKALFADLYNNKYDEYEFIFNVPAEVNPSDFVFENSATIPANKTLYYKTCDQSPGAPWKTVDFTSLTNYCNFPVEFANPLKKITQFRIVYTSADAKGRKFIKFDYLYTTANCSGQPVALPTSIAPSSVMLVAGQQVAGDAKVLNVVEPPKEIALRDFYYNSANVINTGNRSFNLLSPGKEYYVMIDLRPNYDYRNGIANVTFEYNLQNTLEFANADIRFLVEKEWESGYQDINNFKKLIYYVNNNNTILSGANYAYTISSGKVIVSGISFPAITCEAIDRPLVRMLVKVRVKNNSLPIIANSVFVNKSNSANYGFYADYSNFSIDYNSKVTSDIYIACGEDLLAKSYVKTGEKFTYKYIIRNEGAVKLKDITVVGVFPHEGDKFINTPAVSRGSEFSIKKACSQIVAKAVTSDGTETAVPIIVSYKDIQSGVSPEDFDITNAAWNEACIESPLQGIKITTPNGYQLPEFSILEVSLQGIVPGGVQLGEKAINSFALRMTKADNAEPSQIIENKIPVEVELANNSTCNPIEVLCSECVPSFYPSPGKRYVLSAWVKEDFTANPPATYKNSGVKLTFNKGTIALPLLRPKGPIIDGWQRIDTSFTVPSNAVNIQIELLNDGASGEVYFDDIRIHPFNSNVKSFVYDPSTQKLTAELDENNYATKYEYDDEGILIRVKKETERGVMTIKETRNNQSKINTAP